LKNDILPEETVKREVNKKTKGSGTAEILDKFKGVNQGRSRQTAQTEPHQLGLSVATKKRGLKKASKKPRRGMGRKESN